MPTNAESEEIRRRFEASRSFEDDDLWIPRGNHQDTPSVIAMKPVLKPNAPQWIFQNMQSMQGYMPIPTGPRRMTAVAETKASAKSRSSSRSSAYSMQRTSSKKRKLAVVQTQTLRRIAHDKDKDEIESHGSSEHDAKSSKSQDGRTVNGQ